MRRGRLGELNLFGRRSDEGLMMDPGATADRADRRLIERIAARDRTAFDLFYGQYARRVLGFVSGIVHAPELAEEAASDTMIAVWNSAGRYRGRSRVLTWVLGIAHHKAIDALRGRGTLPVTFEALDAPAGGGRIDDALVGVEDRLALDVALTALSVEHRLVLELMFSFDRTQAEIAEIVGCSVATVKTRVFYAKRRLREELGATTAAEKSA